MIDQYYSKAFYNCNDDLVGFDFHETNNNTKIFSILIDIDRFDGETLGKIIHRRLNGFSDIVIRGGQYDGIVLVHNVSFDFFAIGITLTLIRNYIHNDNDLRHIVRDFMMNTDKLYFHGVYLNG